MSFEALFRKMKNKKRKEEKKPKIYLGDTKLGRRLASGPRGVPEPDDLAHGPDGTYGMRVHKAKPGAIKGRGPLGGVR